MDFFFLLFSFLQTRTNNEQQRTTTHTTVNLSRVQPIWTTLKTALIDVLLPQFLTMTHASSISVLKAIHEIDPIVLERGAVSLYKQNPTTLTSILDMFQTLKCGLLERILNNQNSGTFFKILF